RGPVVFATTLPAGSFWSASGSGFYVDPTDRHRVRRFLIRQGFGNQYHIIRLLGRRVSLANAPLTSGDTLHLMLEFESGGVGDCAGDDRPACNAGVARQFCFT